MSNTRFSAPYLDSWKSISKSFKNTPIFKTLVQKKLSFYIFKFLYKSLYAPAITILRPLLVLMGCTLMSHMGQISFAVGLYGLKMSSMGYSFYNNIFLAFFAIYQIILDLRDKKAINYEFAKIRRNFGYILQKFSFNFLHCIIIDHCFAHYNPIATIATITGIGMIKKILNMPNRLALKLCIAALFCHINFSILSDIYIMHNCIKELYRNPDTWAQAFSKNAKLAILAIEDKIGYKNLGHPVPSKWLILLPNAISGHVIWYMLVLTCIVRFESDSKEYPGHGQRHIAEFFARLAAAVLTGNYYFSSLSKLERNPNAISYHLVGRGEIDHITSPTNKFWQNANISEIVKTGLSVIFTMFIKKVLESLSLGWAQYWYPKSHAYWAILYSRFHGLPLAADRHIELVNNDGLGFIGNLKIGSLPRAYGYDFSQYVKLIGQTDKINNPDLNKIGKMQNMAIRQQPIYRELLTLVLMNQKLFGMHNAIRLDTKMEDGILKINLPLFDRITQTNLDSTAADSIMIPWSELITCYKILLKHKLAPIIGDNSIALQPPAYIRSRPARVAEYDYLKQSEKQNFYAQLNAQNYSKKDIHKNIKKLGITDMSTHGSEMIQEYKIITPDYPLLRTLDEIQKDLKVKSESLAYKFGLIKLPNYDTKLKYFNWKNKNSPYDLKIQKTQLIKRLNAPVLNPLAVMTEAKNNNCLSVYDTTFLEALKILINNKMIDRKIFSKDGDVLSLNKVEGKTPYVPVKLSVLGDQLAFSVPNIVQLMAQSKSFIGSINGYCKKAKLNEESVQELVDIMSDSLNELSTRHNKYNYRIIYLSQLENKYRCNLLGFNAKLLRSYKGLLSRLPELFKPQDIRNIPPAIAKDASKIKPLFAQIKADLSEVKSTCTQYGQTTEIPPVGYTCYAGIARGICMKSQIKDLVVSDYITNGRSEHIKAYHQLYRVMDYGIPALQLVKISPEIIVVLVSEISELLWTPSQHLGYKIFRIVFYMVYIFLLIRLKMWPTRLLMPNIPELVSDRIAIYLKYLF